MEGQVECRGYLHLNTCSQVYQLTGFQGSIKDSIYLNYSRRGSDNISLIGVRILIIIITHFYNNYILKQNPKIVLLKSQSLIS